MFFQHRIGVEYHTLLRSLFLLFLDKSEVYFKKATGKFQMQYVCSTTEGVGKSKGTFIFKAVEEDLHHFILSFP